MDPNKTTQKCHYKVLMLEPNATALEIRNSYKKLALLHHPDKNSVADATKKFQELNAAYAVLSDKRRRQLYDKSLIFSSAREFDSDSDSETESYSTRSNRYSSYHYTRYASPGFGEKFYFTFSSRHKRGTFDTSFNSAAEEPSTAPTDSDSGEAQDKSDERSYTSSIPESIFTSTNNINKENCGDFSAKFCNNLTLSAGGHISLTYCSIVRLINCKNVKAEHCKNLETDGIADMTLEFCSDIKIGKAENIAATNCGNIVVKIAGDIKLAQCRNLSVTESCRNLLLSSCGNVTAQSASSVHISYGRDVSLKDCTNVIQIQSSGTVTISDCLKNIKISHCGDVSIRGCRDVTVTDCGNVTISNCRNVRVNSCTSVKIKHAVSAQVERCQSVLVKATASAKVHMCQKSQVINSLKLKKKQIESQS